MVEIFTHTVLIFPHPQKNHYFRGYLFLHTLNFDNRKNKNNTEKNAIN